MPDYQWPFAAPETKTLWPRETWIFNIEKVVSVGNNEMGVLYLDNSTHLYDGIALLNNLIKPGFIGGPEVVLYNFRSNWVMEIIEGDVMGFYSQVRLQPNP